MSDLTPADLLRARLLGASGEEVTAKPVLQDLGSIFREEPVPLTEFITGKRFLGNPRLGDVQYQAVRHLEQVLFLETYRAMAEEMDPYWEPVRMVNFVTCEWGKGSGKDHICRMGSLRIAYILACMRSPQDYFGMPQQDTIHMLNVASTANQAQRAFFKPITRAVKKGWFEDHCEPGMNLVTWTNNLEMISGHSDAESQEGLNLILGVADEIDAFRSPEEVSAQRQRGQREATNTSDAIIKMMRTSGATRFAQTFKVAVISFPRYKGSAIQQQRKKGEKDNADKGDRSRHFVSGPLPTWEVNPRVKGKEDFAEDYEEDPIMAAAKYECLPSRSVQPFIRNFAWLESCVDESRPNPVEVTYSLREREVNDPAAPGTTKTVKAWEAEFHVDPSFRPALGALYAMHGDMALNQDSAGIAMAHVSGWRTETQTVTAEDGLEHEHSVQVPEVTVDFVIKFEPETSIDPPREIQIRWGRELWQKLMNLGFPVVRFTYDGWQSVDSIQQLELVGVESKRVSADTSRDPHVNFRDLAYAGRLSLPDVQDLLDEYEGLTDLAGKIDHPPLGSKDMADACSCAVHGAVEVGGTEQEDGERRDVKGTLHSMSVPNVLETPMGFGASELRYLG